MAIYRAEMSFDGVIVSPAPNPMLTSVVPVGPGSNVTSGGIVLTAGDGMKNSFALSAFVVPHTYGAGPTVEWQASFGAFYRGTAIFIDGLDPWTWSPYTGGGLTQADGANGSAYFGGGTLAIEKDFANNLLTFITPLGNIVRSLTETDGFLLNSANNPTSIWPNGHGQQITRDFTTFPAEDELALLFNFYQKIDGALFFGWALSATDPGLWQPFQSEGFDQFGAISPAFADNNAQLFTRFRQEYQTGAVATTTQRSNEWRYTAVGPPSDYAIDMEKAKEHGVLWRAGVDVNDATAVIVARTFDGGHHWERFTAFSDPLSSNAFPTLNWFKQWIIVTWSRDAADLVQAVSLNGGQDWNTPMVLPYTGTNPRHIIDKNGGIGLYFFFVGGDLEVARSYDVGASFIDVSPIVVATGIGAQTIDAEFAHDGSIVLTVFVAGIWTQYRSTDLGRTWTP